MTDRAAVVTVAAVLILVAVQMPEARIWILIPSVLLAAVLTIGGFRDKRRDVDPGTGGSAHPVHRRPSGGEGEPPS